MIPEVAIGIEFGVRKAETGSERAALESNSGKFDAVDADSSGGVCSIAAGLDGARMGADAVGAGPERVEATDRGVCAEASESTSLALLSTSIALDVVPVPREQTINTTELMASRNVRKAQRRVTCRGWR